MGNKYSNLGKAKTKIFYGQADRKGSPLASPPTFWFSVVKKNNKVSEKGTQFHNMFNKHYLWQVRDPPTLMFCCDAFPKYWGVKKLDCDDEDDAGG